MSVPVESTLPVPLGPETVANADAAQPLQLSEGPTTTLELFLVAPPEQPAQLEHEFLQPEHPLQLPPQLDEQPIQFTHPLEQPAHP